MRMTTNSIKSPAHNTTDEPPHNSNEYLAEQLAANDNLQAELDKAQAEFSAYWRPETDGAVSRWRT